MSFFEELKRRNVVRVGVVYLIASWLLAQVADLLLESFQAPDWVIQAILIVLLVGFPLALILAWAFELTPEGIKKEKDVDRSQSITSVTGRKLDRSIIVVLVVGLAYFVWESRFSPTENKNAIVAENEKVTNPESTVATEAPAKSIAVLPFVNMSSDTEQEYFSDGISEEILNSLAKIKELKVAGRTSSFAFKGQSQDLRQIGDTLGVKHILEGSVRKSGAKVRITAQLIQVDDGFHLWSDTYDRELNDVFAIQDEIATAILIQLKAHLLDGEQIIISSPAANSEAYDQYLLAKQRIYERSRPNLEAAAALLDKAIALEPDYAPAYLQRRELGKARATIERVRPFMPSDPFLLRMESGIELPQGNVANGLVLIERSLEQRPDNRQNMVMRGNALMDTAQWERLAEEGVPWQKIFALYGLGRTEEATILAWEQANSGEDVGSLMFLLANSGKPEELVRFFEKRWDSLDDFEKEFPLLGRVGIDTMLDIAFAYGSVDNEKRFDDAMRRARTALDTAAELRIEASYMKFNEMLYFALSGERAKALVLLSDAINNGMLIGMRFSDAYAAIKVMDGDPEFEAIQARMFEHLNAERAALGREPISI